MDGVSILQRVGNGTFIESLGEAIAEVSQQVIDTGNPGAVNVTLKITQAAPGEPAFIVNEGIKRVMPSRKPRGAYFFVVDGVVSREDPRQVRMELHEVERPEEVRAEPDLEPVVKEVV